jgi:hypothetical protein
LPKSSLRTSIPDKGSSASDDPGPAPQAIATIDPQSGSILTIAAVGNGPDKLVVSGDGACLYVGQDTSGAVTRLVLPALTSDLTMARADRRVTIS